MAIVTPQEFYANFTSEVKSIFCYDAVQTTSPGIWLVDNPLMFSFPLLLFQLTLIFLFTRITQSILSHLSIPIHISQIIGGIILGPSCLGRYRPFENIMYSPVSWEQLNVISFLAIFLFYFLAGLKTDLSMIPKAGKKAFAIAITGNILPSIFVVLTEYFCKSIIPTRLRERSVILVTMYVWSGTSYVVVSCALANLNLLTSKLGRLAMSASVINEFTNLFGRCALGSYVMATKSHSIAMGVTSTVAYLAFMVFLVFVARPLTILAIKRTPEGRMLNNACFMGVLVLLMGCGFIGELIGSRTLAAPFFLGLILPGGAPLGVTMVERLERMAEGVFLPVFLALAGIRMDMASLKLVSMDLKVLLLFLIMVVVGKFFGAMLPCFYCKMPIRDCLAVGLMMTSKGIFDVAAACRLQDLKFLDMQLFTTVVLAVVIVGGGSAPLIKHIYRPEDRFVAYKRRAVQFLKRDSELRILTCIHGEEHVNAILTLLKIIPPPTVAPICLYPIHLKPLVGRTASLLHPYTCHRTPYDAPSSSSSDTDRIFNAFFQAEQLPSVRCSILPYVCISPYATMHEDICSLALDKKVFLIIVPFHKQLDIDGSSTIPIPAIQTVNYSVLRFAPCSVAVLVNHSPVEENTAFRSATLPSPAVYFFGGPDDREALACGLRMAEDPAVGLTVVRFRHHEALLDGTEERLDEMMLEDVRMRRVGGSRVVYREEVVRDAEEIIEVIREVSGGFTLLLVGRGGGKEMPLMSGLSAWSEYPQLGIIGDLLASTDFGSRVSILVVQQQRWVAGNRLSENASISKHVVLREEDEDEDD
ncbi:Cation/H(+) antiporter 15 [Platanthera guangdongensis]|uniref:Cation/H(+) antiporter 15 n=1 Tax=Platanthera guangdongensis TaxID=2320717 RepID=A0ABR2M875_9ASPA